MPEMRIGKVTHYYPKAGAAALGLERPLRQGERVHVLGHTTNLSQTVVSMEINHHPIESAKPGDDVAIKLAGKVRAGDLVDKESAVLQASQ